MAGNITWDLVARDFASSKFDKVGDSVDGNTSKFSKWKGVAVAAVAAVGAAAIKFGKDSVDAFIEAEQSQAKLEDAYKRFPALADVNITALRDFNSELAKKVRFDDDAIASGQSILAQYKLTGSQLRDITPLVADYAAKTGKDFPAAAQTLGKAFMGNTRALKDLGINYKMTGDSAQDMANITALMREKVGGFAEREGKTAAGQAAILKNQFGEIQENVGAKLVPVLTELAGGLLSVVTWMGENETTTKILVGTLGGLAAVVGTIIGLQKIWTAVTTAYGIVQKIFIGQTAVQAGATTAATGAQWSLNAALTANPIGIVVVAIAALVGAIVLAYNKSETFRNIVQGAMQGVVTAFNWVKNAAIETVDWVRTKWDQMKDKVVAVKETIGNVISNIFDPIKTAWNTVKGWIDDKFDAWRAANVAMVNAVGNAINNIFDPIKTAWNNVRDWIGDRWAAFKDWVGGLSVNFGGAFDSIKTAFRSAVNTVIGWWNGLEFSFGGFSKGPINIPGFTVGTPNIPYLAAGGIVTRPTLAMIGEAGPEAVIPLDRMAGMQQPLVVQLVLDGRVIQQSLLRLKRTGGGTELELA